MSAVVKLSPEAQLADDIGSFSLDPLGYVVYNYPWGVKGTEFERHTGPRKWQAEVLDSIGQRLRAGAADLGEVIREAVASGHGIGKSALVAWIVNWAMDTFKGCRGVVTANTENQLRTKTWPEVAKWRRLGLTREWMVCTATSLAPADDALAKNWRIDAVPWSENNTEAFAGLHNEGKRIVLIFDEASKIADLVWEVAEGALTDTATEIIWAVFGNPTRNVGRFRECFRKYAHRWKPRQIDSRTVEGTNKKQIAEWAEDVGEDSDFFKVRVRGLFPNASARQLFPQDRLDAAYGKHLRPEQYSFAPSIIAVDPAWEGDDELVIGHRQGLFSQILKVIPKNDNDIYIANLVARYQDELQADAVFIDMGYGTGIVSAGKTMGRDWRLVNFGEASADPGCLNKRAEMAKLFGEWLKEGGALPPDPRLLDECASIEAKPRMDGKLQLVSKPEMKAQGLPSPNRFDCLAMTHAYPVTKGAQRRTQSAAETGADFDPYA